MRAFPNFRSEGMELRDYFAAKAMQVFLAEKDDAGTVLWEPMEAAEYSYEIADAMMEARKVAAPENKREFVADEMLRGRG